MSFLTLVRHGQASFFADDYDLLCPTGEEQARQLGQYLTRLGESCDEVYTGPRRRQQQTAEFAGASFCSTGGSWPAAVVLDELDEYDLAGLVGHVAPALAGRDPAFAELVHSYRETRGEPDRSLAFQRMFESLTTHWLSSADHVDGVEAWPAFRDRVRRGLSRITDRPGHGRRVLAFTSGGFIGTAVALAVAAPDQTALALNWRMRNGSLTRFLFSPGRLTLDEFNAVPHLNDPALWTYR